MTPGSHPGGRFPRVRRGGRRCGLASYPGPVGYPAAAQPGLVSPQHGCPLAWSPAARPANSATAELAPRDQSRSANVRPSARACVPAARSTARKYVCAAAVIAVATKVHSAGVPPRHAIERGRDGQPGRRDGHNPGDEPQWHAASDSSASLGRPNLPVRGWFRRGTTAGARPAPTGTRRWPRTAHRYWPAIPDPGKYPSRRPATPRPKRRLPRARGPPAEPGTSCRGWRAAPKHGPAPPGARNPAYR